MVWVSDDRSVHQACPILIRSRCLIGVLGRLFSVVKAKRKRLREAAGATALPPSEEHHVRGIAAPLIVLGLLFIWIFIRLTVYSRSTSTWLVALAVLIGVLGVGQTVWGAAILIKRRSSAS